MHILIHRSDLMLTKPFHSKLAEFAIRTGLSVTLHLGATTPTDAFSFEGVSLMDYTFYSQDMRDEASPDLNDLANDLHELWTVRMEALRSATFASNVKVVLERDAALRDKHKVEEEKDMLESRLSASEETAAAATARGDRAEAALAALRAEVSAGRTQNTEN